MFRRKKHATPEYQFSHTEDGRFSKSPTGAIRESRPRPRRHPYYPLYCLSSSKSVVIVIDETIRSARIVGILFRLRFDTFELPRCNTLGVLPNARFRRIRQARVRVSLNNVKLNDVAALNVEIYFVLPIVSDPPRSFVRTF